jgi:hypothetical protein
MNLSTPQHPDPNQHKEEDFVRASLNRIDKDQRKSFIILVLFALGTFATLFWLIAPQPPLVPNNVQAAFAEIRVLILRSVCLLVTVFALFSTKLQHEMNRNARAILQAIEQVRKP